MEAPVRRFTPFLTASLCALLGGAWAQAQVARVFVSVAGNDGNTCSNVPTPCRTFSGAISQVDAGGEVIVLDTGSYGGVTIGKSVKINVPAGVVAFTAQPIVINAGPSDVVVLRGLTVKAITQNVGIGITFTAGASLFVESCVVDGWHDGIIVGGPGTVYVTDSTVRNCGFSGVLVAPASGIAVVSIDRTRVQRNGLASNGCGLQVATGGQASARDSAFTGNAFGACALSASSAILNVDHSILSNNSVGLDAEAGATARFSYCLITQNSAFGVQNLSATIQSLGNSLVAGNASDISGAVTTVAGH
jgi:hypothetical protein